MIKIRELSKSYGDERILNGVNVEIPSGTIQMIIGENGAGKTTLMNLLADIIPKDRGDILIDNVHLSPQKYRYRSNVGYVLEDHPLIERFRIAEFLKFFAHMHGMEKENVLERINDLCLFFGLEQERMIEKLSKGEKQKVVLSSALIHKPRYLILDEPFDSIDFISARKMRTLFQNIADKGTTVVITSHQYDIISELSDKVALLRNGILEFNCTIAELKQKAAEAGFSKEKNSEKKFLESMMEKNENFDIPKWLNEEKDHQE